MKQLLALSGSIQSVACLLWLCALPAWAQGNAVWRCGQLLTNQPPPGQACELSTPAASTVVPGTRVGATRSQPPASSGSADRVPDAGTAPSASVAASQAQARALLQAELREQEARWQQLQAQWNQGQPAATAQETAGSPAYQARVTRLREQMQRTQADVAALKRELARLP